jgi:Mrp family chromosome partitioning ATPase
MTPNSPLASLRQRWWLIVGFAVLGALLGALPAPARVEEQATSFRASHTMLANGTDSSVISPTQVALFASVGEVPLRVADEFGYEGSPATLSAQVQAEFDLGSGALTFTTTQRTAEDAESLVDSFAEHTNEFLTERQDEAFEQRVATSRQRLQELEDELNTLAVQAANDPEDALVTAQRDAISVQYGLAYEQNRSLEEDFDRLVFTTLESGQAVPIVDEGLAAPTGRSTRALMGMVAGGFIGAVIAILIGRLDTKVRSREQAEEIVGMRARVLVPRVRSNQGGVVVRSGSQGPLSDSYRTIRNVVTFVQSALPAREGARVTLVVSPGPGDGKTSVSVNLAAAIAETGSRTLAANADFRRPTLQRALTGRPPPPNPLEIEDLEIVNVRSLLSDTAASRLKIVDFSTVDAAPGELVRALTHRLEDLRSVSEQIVVDTSPVGSTAEVLDLLPHADTIVLVARVGHTSTQAMARAAAILGDIATAPIIFVLEGIKADRSQFYVDTDQNVRRLPQMPEPGEQPTLESVE